MPSQLNIVETVAYPKFLASILNILCTARFFSTSKSQNVALLSGCTISTMLPNIVVKRHS